MLNLNGISLHQCGFLSISCCLYYTHPPGSHPQSSPWPSSRPYALKARLELPFPDCPLEHLLYHLRSLMSLTLKWILLSFNSLSFIPCIRYLSLPDSYFHTKDCSFCTKWSLRLKNLPQTPQVRIGNTEVPQANLMRGSLLWSVKQSVFILRWFFSGRSDSTSGRTFALHAGPPGFQPWLPVCGPLSTEHWALLVWPKSPWRIKEKKMVILSRLRC